MNAEVIILCAGKSSRMGKDKALLKINNQFNIINLINKVHPISSKIIVVLGSNYKQITKIINENNLNKVTTVFNENHESGMFSSIQKGFSKISGNYPIFLQMIDQPFVPLKIYKKLLENYNKSTLLIQPTNSKLKRRGHPLLFSPKILPIVLKEAITSNLRNVIIQIGGKRKYIESENEEIFHNLNTPEKWKKGLKSFEGDTND